MRRLGICLLAIWVLCLGACNKKDPIRVGLNAWPGYEFLYLANKKQFDKELGVETDILLFNSLADGRRSFERGEIDLLGSTVIETVMIKNNSQITPKIVYVADYSTGADVVISPKKIKNVKELKSKKIGVETGSVCILLLYLALKKYGMSLKDVQVIEADQDTIVRGLNDGNLDAGVTYPPFSIEFLNNENWNTLFSSKETGKKIIDVILANPAILKTRKNDVVNILKAFEKARKYTFQEGTDGIEIIAKRENISPKDFKAALTQDMQIISYDDQGPDFFHNKLLESVIFQSFEALKETQQIQLNSINPTDLIQAVIYGE